MTVDGFDADLEHLFRLNDKIDRLNEARADTLRHIFYTLHSDWVTGPFLDDEILLDFHRGFSQCGIPGWSKIWKEEGLPHGQRLKSDVERRQRHAPNDPQSGGWMGQWADRNVTSGTYPKSGVPVVYVLYGSDAEPLYCGSTEQFLVRLRSHEADGKAFVAYRAVACADREAAYDLEDRLLRQHCPPLNRRAGR